MKTKLILLVAIAVVIALSAYFYTELNKVPYHSFPNIASVCGVDIHSKIPVTEFQTKKNVYLFTTEDEIANTCNLEISAVSTPDRQGYQIYIERESLGIYLDNKSAYIRGETDEELLKACHVFLCIREGIDCPENLMEIRNITLSHKDLIVVLDNTTGGPAVRGYIELLGVLGFIQAQMVDANGDGIVEQGEVDNNTVWIYPYVMGDDVCKLQPFRSVIEVLNITNDTTTCDFNSGIYLMNSEDRNEIKIVRDKIIISGDDEHIHAGAIIVRDILSPEWIRVYHGLK